MNDSSGNGHKRPDLVDTGKGLSVFYQERFLYSRYDPPLTPIRTVTQTIIKEETLVFCPSPLLGYGLKELLTILPKSCCIIAVEYDEDLMALSTAHLDPSIKNNPSFKYYRTDSVFALLSCIDSLDQGPFRRCLRLDLSGGSSLYSEFYSRCLNAIDEYISRWWRNHLTLMSLGRNYTRNLFRNLKSLAGSQILRASSIDSPIFIAGAGPSLNATLPFLRVHRQKIFLLCVDTALRTLLDFGLKPDAVIVVESQFWIEDAFSNSAHTNIPIFADLTARPQALKVTGGPVRFFATEFTHASFLSRLHTSIPETPVIPPLGSVGLIALYLSLFLQKEGHVILFSGLDFSITHEFTHSRGSPATLKIHRFSSRLSPAGSQLPTFSETAFTHKGKNNTVVYTDPNLLGYARLCRTAFESYKNIIDVGETGLITCGIMMGAKEAFALLKEKGPKEAEKLVEAQSISDIPINEWLQLEKAKLVRLKALLTGSETSSDPESEICHILKTSEYLYLHFPDGYRGVRMDQEFLKRVRIELEYALKTLNFPLT